jgi:hypothetical protein
MFKSYGGGCEDRFTATRELDADVDVLCILFNLFFVL